MSSKAALVNLYRQFYKSTKNCSDRHLQQYVRRRIREDITKKLDSPAAEIENFIKSAQ